MMGTRKNAVLCLRRSTENQEQSIDDQRRVITAYAKQEGYTVLREYVDDAISGADTAKRDAFHQMIEDASSGDFRTVLVYDVSRFSRDDPDEAGYWRHKLRRRGVEVVYCADTIPDGEEGDLPEAVREIYESFVGGDSYRAVAQGLNARGIPSPNGGRWITSTVRDLLFNPCYCGDAVYNRRGSCSSRRRSYEPEKQMTRSEATGATRRHVASWRSSGRYRLRIGGS